MKERVWISLILLGTFIAGFIFMTIVSDIVDRAAGYYSQGIKDDQNLKEEWR